MAGIYGNGVQMTEKVLDLLWGRQNITLNNIANVDTPGFKSQYMTFEEELAQRVRIASSEKHPVSQTSKAVSSVRPVLRTTWIEGSRLDGNNVDMVQEQVELARTAFEYQAMVSSISGDLAALRSAAKTF